MTIRLYKFAKRQNSTKKPSGGFLEKTIYLKESASVISPVVSFEDDKTTKPQEYNYAYIVDFSRYYFINNWQYNAGRWFAFLEVDVLASHFSQGVDGTNQYIIYSSNNSSPYIADSRKRITAQFASVKTAKTPPATTIESGSYVIGVANGDINAIGSVSYYTLNQAQFGLLKQSLFQDISWTGLSFAPDSEQLFKAQLNPLQYIVSCRWYPFDLMNDSTQKLGLPFGWWELETVVVRKLNNSSKLLVQDFEVAQHPEMSDKAKYFHDSPYSTYILHSAPCNIDALPNSLMANVNTIRLKYDIDLISGTAKMQIIGRRTQGDITLLEKQIAYGVDIELSQMARNYTAMATTVTGTIGALATKNIAGVFNSVGNLVNSAIPSYSSTGSTSSLVGYFDAPFLECIFNNTVDIDPDVYGYPYMSRGNISNCSGYCQIENPQLNIRCYSDEYEKLVDLLTTGFFIER